MSAACSLCGSHELESLPSPAQSQSVTTDGQILPIPWRKRQCLHCGLLQSADAEEVSATKFSYEENYRFYARPLMRAFEDPRYEAYAGWIGSALNLRPDAGIRVLEVGCGAGWLLERLVRKFPGNDYKGIEPSAEASAAAHRAGLDVWNGTAAGFPERGLFDVVYSINVLEHTVDPIAFAATLAAMVRSGGQVCVVCPNGGVVDPEMLFVDHLFSFTKENLRSVLARAGVRAGQWTAGDGLLAQFQRWVGVVEPGTAIPPVLEAENASLLARRRAWMEQWNALDGVLCERLDGCHSVLCFGAGETSDLLRAYAPKTWGRIRGYVIDKPDGAAQAEQPSALHGLPLFYQPETDLSRFDAVLLGTRFEHQPNLYDRLTGMGVRVIRWDDVISSEIERGF